MNQPIVSAGGTAAQRSPRRWWIFACAVVALCLVVERSTAGEDKHQDRDLWFVHATDPHLFIPDAQTPEKKSSGEKQQGLNKQALADMLERVRWLPEAHGAPAFLVLTGDLGIDPCDIPKAGIKPGTPAECVDAHNPGLRTTQVKETADVLSKSPVPDIYLVAGNNDIAKESADDASIKYFNKFIDDVQAALDKAATGIRLHNLTRCYASGEALTTCYADIPNTPYRFIGLPSYSFKNAPENFPDKGAQTRQNEAQVKQLERFREMVKDAQRAARKVLVISHTPEMDDPYQLAQARYVNAASTATATPASTATATPASTATATPASTAAAAPTATPAATETPTPTATSSPTGTPAATVTPASSPTATPVATVTPASVAGARPPRTATPTPAATPTTEGTGTKAPPSVATWNVPKEALNAWKSAIALDSVVAVLAGHLHDSHKEIYRPPYTWSSVNEHRTALHKLFLAPPLAVKKQDSSPIQARGFSLVHLRPDRVESRPFWYNAETREFTPDLKHKHYVRKGGFWRSLWHCPRVIIEWLWNLNAVDSPLVRLAVLLIAFLTAFLTIVAIWQIPPGSDPFADEKKPAQGESQTQSPANVTTDSSPFTNKLGKTVIAGLTGLVAAEVTKTLGNEKPSPDSRWYYIVWFILFFFLLLLSLNLWRAAVEALRARVAVVYYPARKGGGVTGGDVFSHWLSSLRVPLLTFSDTFINLIQGKNQTRTRVFSDTIIEQQRNLVRVADAIRANLNRLIEGRIRDRVKAGSPPRTLPDQLERVRVNISVLSKDQTNVFYISRAPGSSHSAFPKNSVAWASVFTGVPLWFQSTYRELADFAKIVLLKKGSIPDATDDSLLGAFYQKRPQEDYKAFIILPVPSPRRGFGSSYVKGAIQISFLGNEDFESIWKGNEMAPTPNDLTYKTPQRALEDWCQDDDIRVALNNSIAALGELLRGFNEIIYKNYIEPNQPD